MPPETAPPSKPIVVLSAKFPKAALSVNVRPTKTRSLPLIRCPPRPRRRYVSGAQATASRRSLIDPLDPETKVDCTVSGASTMLLSIDVVHVRSSIVAEVTPTAQFDPIGRIAANRG